MERIVEINNQESEIKLKELNTTKDKLYSMIVHDLRSPFNNIIGLSELLFGNLNYMTIQNLNNILIYLVYIFL